VLNVTCVRNVIEEATSLGAAILAASGAGLFPDIAKAAENLCNVDKKWHPNKERHIFYEKIYKFSSELYKTLNEKGLYQSFNNLF